MREKNWNFVATQRKLRTRSANPTTTRETRPTCDYPWQVGQQSTEPMKSTTLRRRCAGYGRRREGWTARAGGGEGTRSPPGFLQGDRPRHEEVAGSLRGDRSNTKHLRIRISDSIRDSVDQQNERQRTQRAEPCPPEHEPFGHSQPPPRQNPRRTPSDEHDAATPPRHINRNELKAMHRARPNQTRSNTMYSIHTRPRRTPIQWTPPQSATAMNPMR